MNLEIIKLRKNLHQHPELSGFESNTALRIQSFINTHHPTTIIDNIGGSGLAAVYTFSSVGPTIAIRCELDALPIHEENQISYRSINNGISHKCGHDGHMAIVSGLIFWIKEQSFKVGKIILLFQPSEENGKGAYKMMEDERFKALNIDFIFALHNIPDEPTHSILIMKNGFSAEVESFSITLLGKESHASELKNGINPAIGIAELVTSLAKLNNENPEDDAFKIITPIHINMGDKLYGISPAKGELHYTIRTWSTERMTDLKLELAKIFKTICDKNQLKYTVEWFEHFPASDNNHVCNEYISKAAITNKFQVIDKNHPFKFGEDFGWFSKKYKTGMFGLGAGYDTPPLHNATYDFPDEIIETGMDMFKEIIIQILKNG